ncbi:MAG: PqqD family protein [Lachnospiraceae bacterium]|nr:PqqD family protein [Lachnospiraceae bacterium]
MKINGEFVVREIAGEYLLIPVGEVALDVHGMISVTESGRLLWDELKSGCTFAQLVETILGEYDVNQETAETDVREFLEKLRKIGILTEED